MITINSLTQRQKSIMDLLWGCETIEQVQTMIRALPTDRDRLDARCLIVIATQDTIEEELGLDEYSEEASDLIDRCR
jgi:hypothetical protein